MDEARRELLRQAIRERSARERAERDVAAPASSGSKWVQCDLQGGGRIVGEVVSGPLMMEIFFGQLEIPFERLLAVAPGLVSKPEKMREIEAQIEQLGAPMFLTRGEAEKALQEYGARIQHVLERYQEDSDAERRMRVGRLLERIRLSEENVDPWSHDDRVEMDEYTFEGKITSNSISLRGLLGETTIPLHEIASVVPSDASKVIDLLALINPGRDAVGGRWRRDGPLLVSPRVEYGRLQLPYDPPEEYELRMTFTGAMGLLDGAAMYVDSVHLMLPVGGVQAEIDINGQRGAEGGPYSGFRNKIIPSRDLERLGSGEVFRLGAQATLVCTVRKNSIDLKIDGVPHFSWKGDVAAIEAKADSNWKLRGEKFLGIGTWRTEYRFSQIELVLLSGPPPGPAPDLSPGDWMVQMDDSSMVAGRPDVGQFLQLPGDRAIDFETISAYERRSDGAYLVRLATGEDIPLDAPLIGTIRMTSRVGAITVSLDRVITMRSSD